MGKRKVKAWKYIVFGLVCGGLYTFFKINGLDLIEQYPVQIGGLAVLIITKIANRWFGWDLSSLFSDEIKEKAGRAVINAQKDAVREGRKIGKKIAGRIRAKWAADKLQHNTGCGKLKARIVTQEVYRKVKKENPGLFTKEGK